jgi:hypothetical protein
MPSLEQIVDRLNAVQNRRCACAYCACDMFDYDKIPPVDDERGWGLLGLIHYADCTWLQTRAFQREIP